MKELNFTNRYWVGCGSSIYATPKTWDELVNYYNSLADIDRHFCRIYDRAESKTVKGSLFWYLLNAPQTLSVSPWEKWD